MENARVINFTFTNESNVPLSLQEISLAEGEWLGEHRPHDFIDPGYTDHEEPGIYQHPFVSIWATLGTSTVIMEGNLVYMVGQAGQAFLHIRWRSRQNGEAMCKLKLEGPGKDRFCFRCEYAEGLQHRFSITLKNKRG
ncbi:hypothetical protein H072_10778 [Dactylellina haptotyla CBS 200.50]|uniref:Uncharacterized protein n=1 Tax=Dactylellina haptotyla (strain CBS 200.50) TaxID=1284197 RepID=S8A3W9_DACHA|nr:hypothetical protein H072_10778 [Dactylellina haptotyla CBS 200.50]